MQATLWAATPATFWLPEGASTVAGDIDWLFYFIYWLCVVFFVGMMGAMFAFMVIYRRRKPDQEALQAPDHNLPIELVWSIGPLIICVFLFVWGFEGYLDLRVSPSNAYEVKVTGYQWGWEFVYPDGTQTDALHVPANVPIRLTIRARDVLHSFFVPAFRVKMDAVPGKITELWFEATTPGTYRYYCTEYCGRGHSGLDTNMKGDVIVYPDQESFEAALEEERKKIYLIEPSIAGAYLYRTRGCNGCHSVDGSAMVGPSFLGNWGTQAELTDGTTVIVDEQYVKDSIRRPDYQKRKTFANANMSLINLKDEEIALLIAFMRQNEGLVDLVELSKKPFKELIETHPAPVLPEAVDPAVPADDSAPTANP